MAPASSLLFFCPFFLFCLASAGPGKAAVVDVGDAAAREAARFALAEVSQTGHVWTLREAKTQVGRAAGREGGAEKARWW